MPPLPAECLGRPRVERPPIDADGDDHAGVLRTDADGTAAADADRIDAAPLDPERAAAFKKLFAGLGPMEHTVLWLILVDRLSFARIARRAGIKLNEVFDLRASAMAKVRRNAAADPRLLELLAGTAAADG